MTLLKHLFLLQHEMSPHFTSSSNEFDHNSLADLPSTIFSDLRNLEYLSLFISSFSNHQTCLTHSTTMNSQIFHQASLQTTRTCFHFLNICLVQMTITFQMSHQSLSSNKFTSVSSDMFSHLTSLKQLSIVLSVAF